MKFEELPDGNNRLLEDESITVDISGSAATLGVRIRGRRLIVEKGFIWDGASGPTIDSKGTQRGAMFHDALYLLMRKGALPQRYRPVADKLLRDLMIKDRQTPLGCLRAWYYYAGVRLFGAKHSAPPS